MLQRTFFSNHISVGMFGSTGELEIRGPNGPFSITSSLQVGSDGTLRITPTANGPAGLIPITAGSLQIGTIGSTLLLDDSLYTPQLGDSWDVATGFVTSATFANLNAPAGITISQAVSKGGGSGTITITVTAVAAATPATSTWGLAVLVFVFLSIAVFYVHAADDALSRDTKSEDPASALRPREIALGAFAFGDFARRGAPDLWRVISLTPRRSGAVIRTARKPNARSCHYVPVTQLDRAPGYEPGVGYRLSATS